jgi:transcriptional regulator with XRE-family HTH domain
MKPAPGGCPDCLAVSRRQGLPGSPPGGFRPLAGHCALPQPPASAAAVAWVQGKRPEVWAGVLPVRIADLLPVLAGPLRAGKSPLERVAGWGQAGYAVAVGLRQGYGELVRSYRVAAGLTQEELAALSGLDVRTIRDIERGRTIRPHRSSADLLARALNREDLAWEAARARLPGPAGQGRASPGIQGSADDDSGVPPLQAVPRQLPGAVRYFTGRAGELAVLTGLLDQAGQERPGTVVISAIGGTAGVGKTALAVHWAHQAAGRFPDGQLYAGLRGYGPDRPVPAADALAGFLRALGVAGQDIPPGADERAARYRSLIAGRKMLVLLDNARSEEQVRPLLPGTASCVTVVTSRDTLAGLVARDGAARLDLDLLPEADATGLLQVLIGRRASADPVATAMVVARCCRLPLALRVAAERAAARPADSLASLAAELAGQRDRLDILDAGGDPATAVRTVFSWSCECVRNSVSGGDHDVTFRRPQRWPQPRGAKDDNGRDPGGRSPGP